MRSVSSRGSGLLLVLSAGFLACGPLGGSPPWLAGSPGDTPDDPDAGQADAGQPDAGPQPVQFGCAPLEACVRAALAMPEDAVYPAHLAALDHLECQDSQVTSLAGLEHATGLLELSVWENQVSDITPLAPLTQLRDLQLGLNQVRDLGPLAGLTALRRLGLSLNLVTSLAPLAALTGLEWLNLDDNGITAEELTHLAGLTSLRWLTLEKNGLRDLSALQPLVAAGCDVYGDVGANKSVRSTPALGPSGPARGVPAGRLEFHPSPGGKVAIHYDTGAERLAVRKAFSGNLVARGGRLFLRQGSREAEVGRADATGQVLCQGEYAGICTAWVGRKGPSPGTRLPGVADQTVVTLHLELSDQPRHPAKSLPGEAWTLADRDLLPMTLASPNQYDAGSCLFMANSGAMEILMNQHAPLEQVSYDGDTDLSERYLMNAPDHVPSRSIPYQLTDILYTYNVLGGSLLSRDYHFCAGWVEETASGGVALSTEGDPDAYVSCSINWFDQMPSNWRELLVPTPPAERTLIFVDPRRDANSQWRVALLGPANIEQIKYELRTKNAPVLVVYNHYLYWHTNIIVGYDDTEDSGGCGMVQDSIEYFEEQGQNSYANRIKTAIANNGGCTTSGVFYVRDSIYDGGIAEPRYDYSTDDVQVQLDRYSKRIIKLPYNWALYLGNHTYTYHRR